MLHLIQQKQARAVGRVIKFLKLCNPNPLGQYFDIRLHRRQNSAGTALSGTEENIANHGEGGPGDNNGPVGTVNAGNFGVNEQLGGDDMGNLGENGQQGGDDVEPGPSVDNLPVEKENISNLSESGGAVEHGPSDIMEISDEDLEHVNDVNENILDEIWDYED